MLIRFTGFDEIPTVNNVETYNGDGSHSNNHHVWICTYVHFYMKRKWKLITQLTFVHIDYLKLFSYSLIAFFYTLQKHRHHRNILDKYYAYLKLITIYVHLWILAFSRCENGHKSYGFGWFIGLGLVVKWIIGEFEKNNWILRIWSFLKG